MLVDIHIQLFMRKLTHKEEEIMKLFWENGGMFVKDMLETFPNPKPRNLNIKLFFILLFCCGSLMAQRNIRVSYAFLYKRDTTEKNYRTEMDMRLDYNGKESWFYSEGRFQRDSLSVKAFDKSGNIADQEAYNAATRHRGTTDLWHVDFSEASYSIAYKAIMKIFLGEKGNLELPMWNLIDSDTTKTFAGYAVKKAEADYLGRKWTVWYTEEVPVNAGPWLLWGCPGLIVYAIDSEKLFNFYVRDISVYEEARWPGAMEAYSRSCDISRLSVKEEEKIKARAKRDMDYFNELAGYSGAVGEIRNKDGSVTRLQYNKFQPLIAESYWK